MFNPDESFSIIKTYIDKFIRLLNNQPNFLWFKTKKVPKKRVDDILCCIEASFPDEYKALIGKYSSKNLNSYKNYQHLVQNIRIKSRFDSNNYSISYEEVIRLTTNFLSSLKTDFRNICESDSNMF